MPSENFWQTFVFLVEENFKIFKNKNSQNLLHYGVYWCEDVFFYCKLVATFQKGLIKFASFWKCIIILLARVSLTLDIH